MNRRTLIFCLGIVLCIAPFDTALHESQSAEKPAAKKAEQERFCVTIWPKSTRIQIDKQFDVMLRVVNASEKTQSFEVMVDWMTSWRITNSQILWTGEAGNRFASNFAVQKRLEPGEAYDQPAELIVDRDPGSAVISFQMGFTPIGEKNTYWSNRVVLGIKPSK